MAKVIELGKKKRKFPSIKAAYEEAKKSNPDLKYITFYARINKPEAKLGLGWTVPAAMKQPVRKYERRAA